MLPNNTENPPTRRADMNSQAHGAGTPFVSAKNIVGGRGHHEGDAKAESVANQLPKIGALLNAGLGTTGENTNRRFHSGPNASGFSTK